jgi:hypothetical protein
MISLTEQEMITVWATKTGERSGVKSRISFCFPHDKPGIDVVIHFHTVKRICQIARQ